MKTFSLLSLARPLGGLTVAVLLAACAGTPRQPTVSYDFGLPPAPAAAASSAAKPLRIGETGGPEWLDSPALHYRLLYAQQQQAQPYAANRWVMSPVRLFDERLRTMAANRGQVAAFGEVAQPLLKVDIVEFSQVFDSPAASRAVVQVRASLYQARGLLAQRTFRHEQAAATADAPGGVAALAQASDVLIAQILDWAAAQPAQ
ncbi:ABC-type transport auxiliary lipoprotein family protein [Imbroritus primus]|jgi:cholesterol transport system auxiliary component|uniref:ABC-type transport auxiliary lipoprotein family protein n=1 Tax=Imbroritus primus TaxID=3058603 RepID=UPI003D1613B6